MIPSHGSFLICACSIVRIRPLKSTLRTERRRKRMSTVRPSLKSTTHFWSKLRANWKPRLTSTSRELTNCSMMEVLTMSKPSKRLPWGMSILGVWKMWILEKWWKMKMIKFCQHQLGISGRVGSAIPCQILVPNRRFPRPVRKIRAKKKRSKIDWRRTVMMMDLWRLSREV